MSAVRGWPHDPDRWTRTHSHFGGLSVKGEAPNRVCNYCGSHESGCSRDSVTAVAQKKDPYCCLSEKMRASAEAFDRGCLTTYRSLKYAVRQLSREEALELIESQIADLEAKYDD